MAEAGRGVPRVRVVVVNYNGGDYLPRCLEHLLATEWPADAIELVVVDNASTDGSADTVATAFSPVRLVRSPRNVGFTGGNNLALHDLDDVDVVALVNPDAFVEPGWLAPLVEALGDGERVGGANPRILLEPHFVAVELDTAGFRPGAGDPRTLGARISGVRYEGDERWGATLFAGGFFDLEADPATPHFRWSETKAELWLPLPSHATPPVTVELRLDADREKEVGIASDGTRVAVRVGPEPRWYPVEVRGEPFDVVNSAGARLVNGAYGAERGYAERDGPRFDAPAEIFAWTGAVAALSADYLRDVGLFDEHFFLYSEELDLSWRGRLRGWRYVYVPESRARHVRGAIVGHRSPVADHYSHRNALLTLVKNAPGKVWRRELRRYVAQWWRLAVAEVFLPLRRRQRPQPHFSRRRARVLAAVLVRLPYALWQRVRIGARATVPRDAALISMDD